MSRRQSIREADWALRHRFFFLWSTPFCSWTMPSNSLVKRCFWIEMPYWDNVHNASWPAGLETRGGHVPMGTVVLGLSLKLAFPLILGPSLSPKVGFFLSVNLAFSPTNFWTICNWARFVPKTGCIGICQHWFFPARWQDKAEIAIIWKHSLVYFFRSKDTKWYHRRKILPSFLYSI